MLEIIGGKMGGPGGFGQWVKWAQVQWAWAKWAIFKNGSNGHGPNGLGLNGQKETSKDKFFTNKKFSLNQTTPMIYLPN